MKKNAYGSETGRVRGKPSRKKSLSEKESRTLEPDPCWTRPFVSVKNQHRKDI